MVSIHHTGHSMTVYVNERKVGQLRPCPNPARGWYPDSSLARWISDRTKKDSGMILGQAMGTYPLWAVLLDAIE